MRPSFGTPEEDILNQASNQSFIKGSNSGDMEIFNEELQNQIDSAADAAAAADSTAANANNNRSQ